MAFRKKHKSLLDLIKGVSLVELITAIALVGVVSIMVISIYLTHFRLFTNQGTNIDLANENRIALDAITNQIRESSAVVSTCSSCGGATTSSTVLVLQLWPLDGSGNPTDPGTSNYDFIVIKRSDLENTKLTRQIIPSGISSRKALTDILSTDVSNLQFAYDNADPTQASEVTVTLTNTSIQYGKTYTHTQTTQAVIRNK